MKTSREIKAVFHDLDRIALAAAAVLAAVYLASGVYVIEANQMGVVFRFGAKKAVVPPGIGYHLPWPVDRVAKVNVKEVLRVEAGFRPGDNKEEMTPYVITGDRNVIQNLYVIQYRIADPANFLSAGARIRDILYELAQATILEEVSAREVDPLLTTGKREMELAIMNGLTAKLDALGIRVSIVGVERQYAEPPMLVKDAFQDVVNAREEKQTKIHEAENYRNQEIPKAKGDANRMIEEAKAFLTTRVDAARGESERFVKLYMEYRMAPGVTRTRLFIEMAETVLPRVKVMVLATDKNGNPLRIKLLQAPVPTTPRLPK